jgi:hypothetical protein
VVQSRIGGKKDVVLLEENLDPSQLQEEDDEDVRLLEITTLFVAGAFQLPTHTLVLGLYTGQ